MAAACCLACLPLPMETSRSTPAWSPQDEFSAVRRVLPFPAYKKVHRRGHAEASRVHCLPKCRCRPWPPKGNDSSTSATLRAPKKTNAPGHGQAQAVKNTAPCCRKPQRLIDLASLPQSPSACGFLPRGAHTPTSSPPHQRARGHTTPVSRPLPSGLPLPLMLNHSHSRPDSRSPFLHRGLAHAAADTEHRDRAQGMDPPSSSGRPTTPRRQLQGPRPPRLNVRMESHAIKKPSGSGVPPAPAPGQGRRDHQPQPQPGRAPVIIYDASPKVIHAKPSEFMALVQRLTGPGGSGTPPPPQPDAQAQYERHMVDDDGDDALLGQAFLPPELLLSPSAAMSPAARLATIERSVRPMPAPATDYDVDIQTGAGAGADDDGTLAAVLGPARHPSILSPLPSSLPPAAASGLFSPLPFDVSSISWLNELSPILRAASTANAAGASSSGFGAGPGATSNGGSRPPPPAYYSDPFVPSPRNLLATPTVPSPATCADFFGSLPDL